MTASENVWLPMCKEVKTHHWNHPTSRTLWVIFHCPLHMDYSSRGGTLYLFYSYLAQVFMLLFCLPLGTVRPELALESLAQCLVSEHMKPWVRMRKMSSACHMPVFTQWEQQACMKALDVHCGCGSKCHRCLKLSIHSFKGDGWTQKKVDTSRK